jgi:inositol phosphorylceramide mannosyltransferase catalytic subunit
MEFDYKSDFSLNSNYRWDFHKKVTQLDRWNEIAFRYHEWAHSINNYSNVNQKIPKHFHQIWLGSKIPKKYDEWRKSWLRFNPGYKYTLWDEQSIIDFGIENIDFFKETKNYGAKSDIARYGILDKIGGIYVDTDFECLKKLDDRLLDVGFFCGQGFDYEPQFNNGIIGSIPNGSFIKSIVQNTKNPVNSDDGMAILKQIGAIKITELFYKQPWPYFDFLSLPSDYFYPWPNFCLKDANNRYDYVTSTTYAIHHWEVSWLKKSIAQRLISKIKLHLPF